VDTVFVCRSTGSVPHWFIDDRPVHIAAIVQKDLNDLTTVFKPSPSDIRCIVHGHLTRLAIWHLRDGWDRTASTAIRMASVARWIAATGGPAAVLHCLQSNQPSKEPSLGPLFEVRDPTAGYGEGETLVSF
jgi:putative DNA methylase